MLRNIKSNCIRVTLLMGATLFLWACSSTKPVSISPGSLNETIEDSTMVVKSDSSNAGIIGKNDIVGGKSLGSIIDKNDNLNNQKLISSEKIESEKLEIDNTSAGKLKKYTNQNKDDLHKKETKKNENKIKKDSVVAKKSNQAGNDKKMVPEKPKTKPVVKKAKPKSPPIKKEDPLVCIVHPGTMEGFGNKGEYLLQGDVRCTYGKLKFKTRKALWNKRRNEVRCEGGIRIDVNGMILKARKGGYNQRNNKIWAEKNVHVEDTSGQLEFTGGFLTYERKSHWLTVTKKPTLKRFYKKEKVKNNKARKEKLAPEKVDTLILKAKKVLYNDSQRIAIGHENVNIIRGNLLIECDTGTYLEKPQLLELIGNPVAKLKSNRLEGKEMYVTLNGEKVTSLALRKDAKGIYFEKKKLKTPINTYNLKGDSLFMKIEKEAMEYVEIFKNGFASQMRKKDSTKINEMFGEYLRLNFNKEKIDEAKVFGEANTTFFVFEKDKFKGKSIAEGDSINFDFSDGKIVQVDIKGKAKGTFYEKPDQKQNEEELANLDSLSNSESNSENKKSGPLENQKNK